MMKRHNPPLYTIMFEHDSQSHIIHTKSDRLKRHPQQFKENQSETAL